MRRPCTLVTTKRCSMIQQKDASDDCGSNGLFAVAFVSLASDSLEECSFLAKDTLRSLLLAKLKTWNSCIIQDSRIARETNRLCGEMVAIVDEREQFLQELDAFPGRLILEKMAEFLRETQSKYT
ncbi:hypothetical protein Tco_1223604 [Tanacetum coccineum]